MSFQLMSKKNFDIYIDLSPKKLSIAAFKKFDGYNVFFKEYSCVTNLDKGYLNFENTEKIIEKNIFEIEREIGEFLNDIYLDNTFYYKGSYFFAINKSVLICFFKLRFIFSSS